MVGWVEAHISLIGAGISFGTLILLIINAVFIWRYVKETKRQADATAVIAKASRAEFEPNVQVTFKERVERTGYENRQVIKGLLINRDRQLVIDIELKNLSKGISDFWLEFNKFTTYISICDGGVKLNPHIWNEHTGQPIVLKPNEIIPGKIFIDLKNDFDKTDMDIGNFDILNESFLSISYKIVYRSRPEPFNENFSIKIKKIIPLETKETFLIGEWSNVIRGYYQEIPA